MLLGGEHVGEGCWPALVRVAEDGFVRSYEVERPAVAPQFGREETDIHAGYYFSSLTHRDFRKRLPLWAGQRMLRLPSWARPALHVSGAHKACSPGEFQVQPDGRGLNE